MRLTTVLKFSMLAPVLCLAVVPVFAQQDSSQQSTGDPVADAARKARAQKKDEPKPKKVFTDDDVKPAAPSASTPAASGSADATKDATAGGTGDSGKNDEAAWRKRFQEQRSKIAQAEKELDVLQREWEKDQVQYYPDPQKAMTQQYTRKDINSTNTKVEAKKQQIAQLKQGLDDLQDTLRRAGGDPGWGR